MSQKLFAALKDEYQHIVSEVLPLFLVFYLHEIRFEFLIEEMIQMKKKKKFHVFMLEDTNSIIKIH